MNGIAPAHSQVRDGYNGYTHLDHVLHAWCGAHLLRDLRSVHDGDPAGQLWAKAMADTLLAAKDAAEQARTAGFDALPAYEPARVRNRYLGALAHGRTHTTGRRGPLADETVDPFGAGGCRPGAHPSGRAGRWVRASGGRGEAGCWRGSRPRRR